MKSHILTFDYLGYCCCEEREDSSFLHYNLTQPMKLTLKFLQRREAIHLKRIAPNQKAPHLGHHEILGNALRKSLGINSLDFAFEWEHYTY